MRRLLDYDPLSGVHVYHDYDPVTDETRIEEWQDVAPFLETNTELRNDEDYKKRGIKNEWWHVARIPVGVQNKWLHEHGVDIFNKDHMPAVKRLLNSPEWRYLRTATGKI